MGAMKHVVEKMAVVSPFAVALVGTHVDGAPNFCLVTNLTVGDLGSHIVIGIGTKHHTWQGIQQNAVFSVNLPDTQHLRLVDACAKHSGRDRDKATGFTLFYGTLEHAPMIEEFPITMECRVREIVELETHAVIIGSVVQSFVEESSGNECFDPVVVDPILYCLDGGYYKLGPKIGTVGKPSRS